MLESSQFTDSLSHFESFQPLEVQGATCDTFLVKLYGKLHFLKRLKPAFSCDIRYQEAFRKEFEIGYRLEHPNLVRYIFFSDDGILMEYVDGETLNQRLVRQPSYFKKRKNTDKFVCQLLDVVGYLHSHQVLHLDLKPDNIMFTRIGDDVKLVDLGCCLTDTFADTPGRTPAFAAPEQHPRSLNDEVPTKRDEGNEPRAVCDVRTDIYAIGKILQSIPHPIIYNNILARCTATDKAVRYDTVEKLRAALRHRSIVLRRCVVGVALIGLSFLFLLLAQIHFKPLTANVKQRLADDTLVQENSSKEPVHDSASQPSIITPVTINSNPVTAKNSSLDVLKADIRRTVSQKFQATMGLLSDSVKPGTLEWAEAGQDLLDSLQHTLQDIILRHQSIHEETISKEYHDYVESLIMLRYNRAIAQPY